MGHLRLAWGCLQLTACSALLYHTAQHKNITMGEVSLSPSPQCTQTPQHDGVSMSQPSLCTDPTAWWGLPISWLFTLHWLQNLPSQQIIPHDLFISRTLTLVHLQRHLFKLMSNCRFLELGLGHIYFGEHNSTYDTLFLPNSHSSHILNIFTPSQHLQNFQLLHIRSLSKNLTYISSALISKSNMGDSTVHPGAEFLSNFVKSEKWAISRYRGGCSYLKEEKMWKLERAPEFLFCSDIWGSGKLHSILTS